MHVAVTGASGHVGANLVRSLLADGREVRALAFDDSPALAGLDVEEIRGNVLEPDSFKRVFDGAEAVYHLAAMITLRRRSDPVAHRVNVEGTRNVVECCNACGVRRLVYFSSIHAFSPFPLEEPIDESRPLCSDRGSLPYDRSKAAAERVVRAAVEDGLDAVIVNPTGVMGPHDYEPSAMGRVLLALRDGRYPALVRGGFNWVDARDVVAGARAAEATAAPGARYILGGHYATVGAIAAIVSEATGRPVPKLELPLWAARMAAPFAVCQAYLRKAKPQLTAASLHALRHHQNVDWSKAARELGYQPRPLKETIADALAWFDAKKETPPPTQPLAR